MDDITQNIDDRQKYRKEKMEKMRQEKEQQRIRRQRIKKWFPIGAFAFVVFVSIIIGCLVWGKHKKVTMEVVSETSSFNENAASQGEIQAEVIDLAAVSEKEETDVQITEPDDAEEIVKYSFMTTQNTVEIVNEEVISSNAILIDENNNTIVAAKGAKERISPASMTKVLTILVAAEHITEEQLEDTFVMTREIMDYGYVNDCSAVGFLEGEKIRVRDLFYGTILPSGVDAAVGLATYVAGSHEAFVDMMNEKLKELGLSETSHYTNCVGIFNDDHYSTVYDMAVIMKAAIQNEFCKTVLSEHNYTTAATEEHPEGMNISNWFLRRIEDKEVSGEVLCAKTGYVRQSKNCAVSYGKSFNGNPYICVTAGSSSNWRCIYDHVEIYNYYTK